MLNWKSLLFLNSQSNPGLAISGDFSDEEDFRAVDDDDADDDQAKISSCSIITSESTDTDSSYLSSRSSSLKSKKITVLSPQLSWQRNWLLIPSYSLIFLTVLPFLQGCLYTIGYRLGRKTLKLIVNKL